jgi:hypothetical protein
VASAFIVSVVFPRAEPLAVQPSDRLSAGTQAGGGAGSSGTLTNQPAPGPASMMHQYWWKESVSATAAAKDFSTATRWAIWEKPVPSAWTKPMVTGPLGKSSHIRYMSAESEVTLVSFFFPKPSEARYPL